MQADLLLDLANFLDRLPSNRFDYRRWVGRSWKGRLDLSCGTTACALGWAATIPSIQARGLQLFAWDRGVDIVAYIGDSLSSAEAADVDADPNDLSMRAASRVFEITIKEARFLFIPRSILSDSELRVVKGPDGEPMESPSVLADNIMVAAHIRRFLLWKQAQPAT